MKVLIAYGTLTGQTEKVALLLAAGMRAAGLAEVVVKKVDQTSPEDFRAADVWMIGSPTHYGGATRGIKMALKQAVKEGTQGKRGMAFDTRYRNRKGASDKIEGILTEGGVQLLSKQVAFFVTKALDEGEEERAAALGRKLSGLLQP